MIETSQKKMSNDETMAQSLPTKTYQQMFKK